MMKVLLLYFCRRFKSTKIQQKVTKCIGKVDWRSSDCIMFQSIALSFDKIVESLTKAMPCAYLLSSYYFMQAWQSANHINMLEIIWLKKSRREQPIARACAEKWLICTLQYPTIRKILLSQIVEAKKFVGHAWRNDVHFSYCFEIHQTVSLKDLREIYRWNRHWKRNQDKRRKTRTGICVILARGLEGMCELLKCSDRRILLFFFKLSLTKQSTSLIDLRETK